MAKRYFEFVEGTSSKFWEVWIDGNSVLTRYGKIQAVLVPEDDFTFLENCERDRRAARRPKRRR